MKRCEHYTFDCKEEICGCEGCGFYEKPIAKKDVAYCMNENCATKEECDRYYEHYKYDNIREHEFFMKCEEYQG